MILEILAGASSYYLLFINVREYCIIFVSFWQYIVYKSLNTETQNNKFYILYTTFCTLFKGVKHV